jgi:hypothetical protein
MPDVKATNKLLHLFADIPATSLSAEQEKSMKENVSHPVKGGPPNLQAHVWFTCV